MPKIWIADDDEAIRMVLEEGLKSAGLEIVTFADGESLIDALNPIFFLLFNILTIVLCKFKSSEDAFIFSEISKRFLVSAPVTPLLSFPFSGL